MSRDSLRTLLIIAASNNLDVLGCNVQNAFLPADDSEKHCLIVGDEFGHDEGKILIAVGVSHGLNSASAALGSLMARNWMSSILFLQSQMWTFGCNQQSSLMDMNVAKMCCAASMTSHPVAGAQE